MTQPEFTEEELRRLEAEMERISVDDVLIQTTVTLLNLAARKAGLAAPPGEAPAADWEQVRQTLSQLQMIYAQQAGGAAPAADPEGGEPPAGGQEGEEPAPEGPGPAQSSGRLWIPGQ